MFVTKRKYDQALKVLYSANKSRDDWSHMYIVSQQRGVRAELDLRAAESALHYKDDVIEELQAEVYELNQVIRKVHGVLVS